MPPRIPNIAPTTWWLKWLEIWCLFSLITHPLILILFKLNSLQNYLQSDLKFSESRSYWDFKSDNNEKQNRHFSFQKTSHHFVQHMNSSKTVLWRQWNSSNTSKNFLDATILINMILKRRNISWHHSSNSLLTDVKLNRITSFSFSRI